MTAPRLGVVFRPQLPPERLRPIAEAADAAGLDELWLWEDCFAEAGISAAAAALAWTENLHIGIGLLPVPLRNVALTAMETATLARLFPGRVTIGIGHGILDWMGQVGVRAGSPMTLLREYTTALRSLLDGVSVTTNGRYVQLDDVRLAWPPEQVPRLLIGAGGARTIAMSGELTDGTLLSGGTTPAMLRRAREQVDAVRAAAGVSAPHESTVYLIATTGPGAAERAEAEARLWDLEPSRDVAVWGTPERLADGIRRWADAGANAVILQPTGDEPDLEGFIDVVARQVRPLL